MSARAISRHWPGSKPAKLSWKEQRELEALPDRIAALEQAIKQGDELGTREELARWRAEFKKKACQQYDY